MAHLQLVIRRDRGPRETEVALPNTIGIQERPVDDVTILDRHADIDLNRVASAAKGQRLVGAVDERIKDLASYQCILGGISDGTIRFVNLQTCAATDGTGARKAACVGA